MRLKNYFLAGLALLAASTGLTADNLIGGTNGSSNWQLIDNTGRHWKAAVGFTTDGSGDIFTLGDVASTDNIIGQNPSGNRQLIDNSGRRWNASVLYTTDGSGNVIPVPTGGGGGGSGTVTSVGLSLPGIFTVSGSPVTTSGTLTGTLATETANKVWSGPTTGSAAAPTFRSLVGADLPNPSSTTLGGIESYANVAHQWINSISTSGVPSSSQPAFSDISGTASTGQLPTGSLTESVSSVLTISGGTGATIGAGTTLQVKQATTSQSGYLSSTDWNTFNNKASFAATSSTQEVFVRKSGSDVSGCGSLASPCLTIVFALSQITDASLNKKYFINVGPGQFDESSPITMKCWVWIGGQQYFATRVSSSNNLIGLDSCFATGGNRAGMKDIYLRGTTGLNLDLQSIGGAGTPSAVLEFQHLWMNGGFVFKGRNSAGQFDFFEAYDMFIFGASTVEAGLAAAWNMVFNSTLTISADNGQSNNTWVDSSFVGAVTISNGGASTQANQFQASGISSLITTGTQTLKTDGVSLPIKANQTLSGGTTITYTSDATAVGYTPTTSGNWNSVPTNTQSALDTLASSGVVKSQSQNLVLASPNGSSGVMSARALVLPDLPSLQVNKYFYVDGSRTDTYTADGSPERPFKTISASISQVITNGDNSTNAYAIIVMPKDPGYNETLSFNSTSLVNLSFYAPAGATVGPGSGSAITSTSNNTQLGTLIFQGFTMNGGLILTGDINNTNLCSVQCVFSNTQFNTAATTTAAGVNLTNVNNVSFYNSTLQNSGGGTYTWQNVAFAYMSGPEGLKSGTTLALVNNNGANQPSQNAGGNYFLMNNSKNYATTTVDAGSELDDIQTYYGSGGTVTVNGTFHTYDSFFNGSVVLNSGSSVRFRGSLFTNNPTINGGASVTNSATEFYASANFGATAVPATNVVLSLKDGHIKSAQTTAPTTTVNANAGSGATCAVTHASDNAGTITLVTGTGVLATGDQCDINFNKAYNVAPICSLTPANSTAGTAAVGDYASSSTSALTLNFGVAAALSSTYVYNYQCIETQ